MKESGSELSVYFYNITYIMYFYIIIISNEKLLLKIIYNYHY